jgi:hypothetical protein
VDEVAKIDLYNEYMERAQHQFRSLALNGSLHSTHTLYAMGYIDACSNRVCQDLRMLTERVFGDSDVLVTTSDDMEVRGARALFFLRVQRVRFSALTPRFDAGPGLLRGPPLQGPLARHVPLHLCVLDLGV